MSPCLSVNAWTTIMCVGLYAFLILFAALGIYYIWKELRFK